MTGNVLIPTQASVMLAVLQFKNAFFSARVLCPNQPHRCVLQSCVLTLTRICTLRAAVGSTTHFYFLCTFVLMGVQIGQACLARAFGVTAVVVVGAERGSRTHTQFLKTHLRFAPLSAPLEFPHLWPKATRKYRLFRLGLFKHTAQPCVVLQKDKISFECCYCCSCLLQELLFWWGRDCSFSILDVLCLFPIRLRIIGSSTHVQHKKKNSTEFWSFLQFFIYSPVHYL